MTTDVTSLPEIARLVCTIGMTGYEEKDPAASGGGGSHADPQPANEALPDGQFQDQEMPTTDGEPADPDPLPSTHSGDVLSQGDAARDAAVDDTDDN